MHRGFSGCSIKRIDKGDTPDYFCAESVDRIFLAEAKGRYTSINFKNKDFDQWRKQFDRVQISDSKGRFRKVKGHIIATRFATEIDSTRIRTTVYAEDPESPGEGFLEGESTEGLGAAIIGSHYGQIAEKLNQPLLASALINGVQLPDEIIVPVILWEMGMDPVKERRFIGGYFPGPYGDSAFEIKEGKLLHRRNDLFRLDAPSGTFFGVEEKIFRQIVSNCRLSGTLGKQISQDERIESIYSGISMLRDGSVVGPVEFFTPLQQVNL